MKIIASILVACSFLFLGCTKEQKDEKTASVNKNIFLSVTINGKVLNSYGVNSNLPSPNSSHDFMNIEVINGGGGLKIVGKSHTQAFPYLPNDEIQLNLEALKFNDPTAGYRLTGTYNWFFDKTAGNRQHLILPVNSNKLYIESIQDRIARGNFSFTVFYEGIGNVPATGKFALWVN